MKKLLLILSLLISAFAQAQTNFCVYPPEGPYGDYINRTSFYGLNDFTTHGSITATLNSGTVDLTGGSAGVYTNYVTIGDPDQMPNFHGTIQVKIKAVTSNSGMAFGRASINGTSQYDLANVLTLSTANTSPVYISGLRDGNLFTTGSAFTYSLNDIIQIDVDLNVNVFTVNVKDITTSGATVTATYTWTTPTVGGAGGYWPNSGNFAIWNMGGTQEISYMDFYSTTIRFPSVLLLADSKIRFGTTSSVTWANGAGNQLSAFYPSVTIVCDEGSSTSEQIACASQALAFGSRMTLIEVSSNDRRRGASLATIAGYIDNIFNLLNSPTNPVYFFIIQEDSTKSGVGLTDIKNYLVAKYSSNYISGVWTAMGGGTNILSSSYTDGSGIHLSLAGHNALYAALVAWGGIPTRYCANRSSNITNFGTGLILKNGVLSVNAAEVTRSSPGNSIGTIVSSITNSDGTITISPTTGAAIASLALGHANTWSANQLFPKIGVNGSAATYGISDNSLQTTTANMNLGGTIYTQAFGADNQLILVNSFINGGQHYQSTNPAYAIQFNNGRIILNHAVSGTSGTSPSFVVSATFDVSSRVGFGTVTSPTAGVSAPPSLTGAASFNIPSGTIPTSPNVGDFYNDGTNMTIYMAGFRHNYDLTHYVTESVSSTGNGTMTPSGGTYGIAGTLKVVDGTQANGYSFLSDAAGNGSWVNPNIHPTSTSAAGSLTLSVSTPGWNVFTGTTTTWTLPAVSGNSGFAYFIKNRGSGAITLQRGGSDNLFTTTTVTSITINAGSSAIIYDDATYWNVMLNL